MENLINNDLEARSSDDEPESDSYNETERDTNNESDN